MAKYTVTHSCGHTETHQIYGPHKDRPRRAEWLGNRKCEECRSKDHQEEREAENASAAEANAAAGLPALEGSERQVAWAESIRRPICEELKKTEAKIAAPEGLSPEAAEEWGDAVVLIVDEIRGRTSAKWWIDEGRLLGAGELVTIGSPPWVYRRIKERGLAPRAEQELRELRVRREEEEAAENRRRAALLADLAAAAVADPASLEVDLPAHTVHGILLGSAPDDPRTMTYDADSGTVIGEVLGRDVSCEVDRGSFGALLVDGVQQYYHIDALRHALMDFGRAARALYEPAARAARGASLEGVEVAGVKKVKTRLAVELADGRELTGESSRAGWRLTYLSTRPGSPGGSVDPEHPEVERIAAAAKAWEKAHRAKKGA